MFATKFLNMGLTPLLNNVKKTALLVWAGFPNVQRCGYTLIYSTHPASIETDRDLICPNLTNLKPQLQYWSNSSVSLANQHSDSQILLLLPSKILRITSCSVLVVLPQREAEADWWWAAASFGLNSTHRLVLKPQTSNLKQRPQCHKIVHKYML